MKLFLTIISIICLFILLPAQDKIITSNMKYAAVGGATGDTINSGTSVSKTYFVNIGDLYQYRAAMFTDKVSGTTDSVFVTEYVSLDGANWVSNAVDTIKTANADSYTLLNTIADVNGRYFKYTVTGDGNTATQRITFQYVIWRKEQ